MYSKMNNILGIVGTMVLRGLVWCLVVNVVMASNTDNEVVDGNCGGSLSLNPDRSMKLQLKKSLFSQKSSDCRLTIRTTPGQKIMLLFSDFNVQYSDWVELRDGRSSSDSYVSGLYGTQTGSYLSGVYETTGRYLYIRIKRSSGLLQSSFKLILTSYHTGTCDVDEFRCNNGRCISKDVRCNGYNACGDYSDCPLALTVGAIVGIVIGGITVTVIVIVSIGVCRRQQRLRRLPASTVMTPPPMQSYPPPYSSQPPQPSMYSVQSPYPMGQQMPKY